MARLRSHSQCLGQRFIHVRRTHKAPYWTVSRAWAQATRLARTRERDCIVSVEESATTRREWKLVSVFLWFSLVFPFYPLRVILSSTTWRGTRHTALDNVVICLSD